MSKSKFINTPSEYKNIFALQQKAIVLSFAKMLHFYCIKYSREVLGKFFLIAL